MILGLLGLESFPGNQGTTAFGRASSKFPEGPAFRTVPGPNHGVRCRHDRERSPPSGRVLPKGRMREIPTSRRFVPLRLLESGEFVTQHNARVTWGVVLDTYADLSFTPVVRDTLARRI
jgi:hypothetical protein